MADLARRGPAQLSRNRRDDGGQRIEYLAFRLGVDVYAAQVARIREILKPPPLTPVPRAPGAIMGIISVRGQLVTVIDLRRRLRLDETSPTRRSRILLTENADGETLGLYVDEVMQVYRLTDGEIEHTASALGGDVAGYIAGIARPSRLVGSAARAAEARRLDGLATAAMRAFEDAPGTSAPIADASVVILLDLRAVLTL